MNRSASHFTNYGMAITSKVRDIFIPSSARWSSRLMLIAGIVVLIITLAHATPLQKEQVIVVTIFTEVGAIKAELYPERAPVTVENFLKYVDKDHYDGGSFFRTVRDDNQPDSPVKIDVIQAGPHPWFQFFDFDPISLERTSETGLRHLQGTISMARSDADSATSSFFICVEDEPELDFGGKRNPDGQGFAAFGLVTEGLDVIRKIHQSEINGQAIKMPVRILDIRY